MLGVMRGRAREAPRPHTQTRWLPLSVLGPPSGILMCFSGARLYPWQATMMPISLSVLLKLQPALFGSSTETRSQTVLGETCCAGIVVADNVDAACRFFVCERRSNPELRCLSNTSNCCPDSTSIKLPHRLLDAEILALYQVEHVFLDADMTMPLCYTVIHAPIPPPPSQSPTNLGVKLGRSSRLQR